MTDRTVGELLRLAAEERDVSDYPRERVREMARELRHRGYVWKATQHVPHAPCVYYMQVGNRVKIGFTTNLRTRMDAIMPEALLAVEPGDRAVEQARHRQFRDLRVAQNREWFRMADSLLQHIREVHARGHEVPLDRHGNRRVRGTGTPDDVT